MTQTVCLNCQNVAEHIDLKAKKRDSDNKIDLICPVCLVSNQVATLEMLMDHQSFQKIVENLEVKFPEAQR